MFSSGRASDGLIRIVHGIVLNLSIPSQQLLSLVQNPLSYSDASHQHNFSFLSIISRCTIISLNHSTSCYNSSQSSTLPHCMVIRFSDAEAARVKSASKLVSSIATSSTGLQEGIFNMACESAVLDAHHAVPSSSAYLFFSSPRPLPIPRLLHILYSSTPFLTLSVDFFACQSFTAAVLYSASH